MLISVQILMWTPIAFVFLYLMVNRFAKTPKHVCIVVLGDIGRSPRMIYHALSFAEEGFKVFFVGYSGSAPPKKLTENTNIHLHYVRHTPAVIKYFPKLVQYLVKAIWQAAALSWVLLLLPKMGSYLIQNPPSIPTMAVAYMVSRVRASSLVTDWHNYGHTILALAHGTGHHLVKVAKTYEKICGSLSDFNICVTRAMRMDLERNWKIKSITVYDRPPSAFRSISAKEQHQLFVKLSKEHPVFCDRSGLEDSTIFTKQTSDGDVVYHKNRPALLVSSTSWTEDEDFGILLQALKGYDSASQVPRLICVITGKGPQKEFYRRQIEEGTWEKVQFCLPWLEAEDYPLLLASANVGVCMHMSSSGLDLPMKVVDMFGCGLPVCAVRFDCIGELVKHDVNGYVFEDSLQLFHQLQDLLGDFPSNNLELNKFQENLKSFQTVHWHDQWKQLVLPIFEIIAEIQKPPVFKFKGKGGIPDGFDDIGREEETQSEEETLNEESKKSL